MLQKEREFYVLEMQADRELKVRLDAVLTLTLTVTQSLTPSLTLNPIIAIAIVIALAIALSLSLNLSLTLTQGAPRRDAVRARLHPQGTSVVSNT